MNPSTKNFSKSRLTGTPSGEGMAMSIEKASDILQEIINIGMGKAAAALAELVNQRIHIRVPVVQVLPANECQETIAKTIDSVAVYVSQDFRGLISGKSILVYTKKSSLGLLNLLMPDWATGTSLSTAGLSTLQEIGNILLGSCVTELVDFAESPTKFDLPTASIEISQNYFSNLLQDMQKFEKVIVIQNVMEVAGTTISSHIFIILSVNDLEIIEKRGHKYLNP